jgi:hypothetical protein
VRNHLRLNFDLVEGLSIVHADDATNHLRHYDHVPEMSPHRLGLLTRRCLTFRLPQLLDKSHGLTLETTLEPPACSGVEQLHELVGAHVQEGIEIDTPEGELLERPLLWLHRSDFWIDFRHLGNHKQTHKSLEKLRDNVAMLFPVDTTRTTTTEEKN